MKEFEPRQSSSLLLKLLAIAGLTLVVLIALYQVENVITERQAYRDEATRSISGSYASEQRILGPMLVQPYRRTVEVNSTENGKAKVETRVEESILTVFPATLAVNGQMRPSVRRHGLYRVPVYEFDGNLSGRVQVPEAKLTGKVEYGIPYLAFRLKDTRGIVGRPVATVNGADYAVEGAALSSIEQDAPAHPPLAWGTNLRILLPDFTGKTGTLDFSLNLALAGTQRLEVVPVADSNHFELTSSWTEPLFGGQFLPRTRDLSKDGFRAQWDISSLASGTQQQIIAKPDSSTDAVSVTLASSVDAYTLADRAVKYGILFVLITFGGFFLFELVKKMLIHPVQYLLVGACLTIFFLLLVSLSEHIPFPLAYLISSAACIGLLTYYLVFVLHSREYGLGFGAILTALYGAIYGLLVSEDNALVLGSLLLFGLLAIIMIGTRRVDWYQKTADLAASTPPRPFPPAA